MGVLPPSHPQPLYVRLRHAPGRRHHGRQRPPRQSGHLEGMAARFADTLVKVRLLYGQVQGGKLVMPLGQRVVLIAGGHNALIAAFYLAKGGFRPLVLDPPEMPTRPAPPNKFHPTPKPSPP